MMQCSYVGDVMTTDVVAVPPDMPYKAVADLLVHYGVSAAPVVHLLRLTPDRTARSTPR
jgi:CBS domain-containing protein